MKHLWLYSFLIHFISWAFYEVFCILHSKVGLYYIFTLYIKNSYIFAKVLQPCLAEISGQNTIQYSVKVGIDSKFPPKWYQMFTFVSHCPAVLLLWIKMSWTFIMFLSRWSCFMSQLACDQELQHTNTAGYTPTASKTDPASASLSIFCFLCPLQFSAPTCQFLKKKCDKLKTKRWLNT